MELLEKLTLYDILGYTVPGSVFLVLWQQDNLQQMLDMGAGGTILFIALGFLTGIMISEIMFWAEKLIAKFFAPKQWDMVCKKYNLENAQIRRALRNASILRNTDEEDMVILCVRYCAAMYADIQADSNYSRIHNYASAALLYKNMVLVALFCTIAGWSRVLYGEMVIGIIGTICFGMRWQRFDSKKIGYTVCWFIKKYAGKTR